MRCPYFVTFRLEDSLPTRLLLTWKNELDFQKHLQSGNPQRIHELEDKYLSKIEGYLDTNSGHCWLKDSRAASIVAGSLCYFDNKRYFLHSWTIMPNHVHVLLRVAETSNLSSIVHGWKSYTANQINRLLGRSGRLWQPEYYDRLIRSERQFEFTVRYILNNPVKAGLCKEAFQWRWSGCSVEITSLLNRFFS
jgi:REP element-mobilizing transposase RayT